LLAERLAVLDAPARLAQRRTRTPLCLDRVEPFELEAAVVIREALERMAL